MKKPREIKIRFTANDKQIDKKEYYRYVCASIDAEMKNN